MKISAPTHVRHVYTQQLAAEPGQVFPLLCPVREVDWARGWAPKLVLTHSGFAEQDCVFVVPGDRGDAVWVVTRFEPEKFAIAFVKLTPGETVGWIDIQLQADGAGGTRAEVAYAYTALGASGELFVRGFTEEHYRQFMREWEAELNHYLATGRMLGAPVPPD